MEIDSAKGQTRKMKWSDDEDNALRKAVDCISNYNWSLISESLPGRSGKQCRERWANQLNPDLKHDLWTPDEEDRKSVV